MKKAPVFLCLVTCFSLSLNAELAQKPVNDEQWEFLLLAQFWPGSSCVYFRKEGCKLPPGLDGWTIHGLWPSRNTTTQPAFCNNTMKFNYSEIEVLHSQLDKYWPNYNSSSIRTYLWEHEWEKHGTCAYSLPVIQGELNYFNATIQLYRQLNINEALSKASIVPEQDKQYNLNEVYAALLAAYKKIPQIECYYADGNNYLDQVWLCYDKTLQLTDCPVPKLSSYRQLRSKAIAVQKPYLQFESEKSVDDNISQDGKNNPYFVDCPKDDMVYYIPIPQGQVLVEEEMRVKVF